MKLCGMSILLKKRGGGKTNALHKMREITSNLTLTSDDFPCVDFTEKEKALEKCGLGSKI